MRARCSPCLSSPFLPFGVFGSCPHGSDPVTPRWPGDPGAGGHPKNIIRRLQRSRFATLSPWPSRRSFHGHLWSHPSSGIAPTQGGEAGPGPRCVASLWILNLEIVQICTLEKKNPWGIKYLQKISSCVNNRKIQYSASGPVFDKFENFMILLLLFIAYFICRCLSSRPAWIWVFEPGQGSNSCCPELCSQRGRDVPGAAGRARIPLPLPARLMPPWHGPSVSRGVPRTHGSPVGAEGSGG